MASGGRNERFISTKRIFRVSRKSVHNLNPAVKPSTGILDSTYNHMRSPSDNSSIEDRLSHPTYPKPDCGIKLSPSSQNYSSRNSLRAAQSVNVNNHRDKDMSRKALPNLFDHDEVRFVPGREITDNCSYEVLTSECFVRYIDDESNLFYCMLCCKKWAIQSDEDVARHLNSPSHNNRFFNLQQALYRQPFGECSLQSISMREKLRNWYDRNYLSQEDKFIRDRVVEEFKEILRQIDPNCECRLYGSCLTGIALKSSDINLELTHSNSELFAKDPRAKNSIHHKLVDASAKYGEQLNNHVVHYDLIPNAVDTLFKLWKAHSSPVCDILSFRVINDYRDLNKKMPELVFLHKATNIELKVSCYTKGSCRLSSLIETYLSLDQRARILSFLVRYWAKICRIDKPDNGTLPPEAYTILVIYFLQRTSPPILPCLHESIVKSGKPDNVTNKSILNHLEHDLRTDEAKLGKKAADIISEAVEVEEVEDEEDEEFGHAEITTADLEDYSWTSKNKAHIHTLFANFISLMIDEFNEVARIITIRTLKDIYATSKPWNTQIKAIENPVMPRANMSRCIGTHRQFNYICECFKHCYFYLTSLPLTCRPDPKPRQDRMSEPRDYTKLYINIERFTLYFNMKLPTLLESVTIDTIKEMIQQNLFAKDIEVISTLLLHVDSHNIDLNKLPAFVAAAYNEDFLIPRDTEAITYCRICKKVGHLKHDCQKSRIENLDHELEIYDYTLDRDADLDFCFKKLYDRSQITPRIRQQHRKVVRQLSIIINSSLHLNCELELFGSTVNNLGSVDSDLDICMTIKGNPTGENIDCVHILQRVCGVFSGIKEIESLEPILTARVPILRFKYDIFDVDLCMYNQCAIHNSQLLKTYSLIDDRLPQIFYLVKRFAKECGIADASKFSLSSYAWALLVIHYLQHTNPPILPVLQEPIDAKFYGVNGWNVWFRTDIDDIKMQHNDLRLTQLFKGFFLYYGNFNFDLHVVSIRKFEPISRYQKNWHNCMMAIEGKYVFKV